MPTTSNFGWNTPADTDLVKDGAAAIRTLGNNIDASLVDLKGGTTGQVLAKASNSDLDFTWATDASGIPATIFDAKGDIIAASAADTAARLAVGTNGQVLTADSAEATGLKWITPAAGGAYTSLATGTLSGATTTISSIPGTYTDLYLVIVNPSVATDGRAVAVRVNSDSTSSRHKSLPYDAISASGTFDGNRWPLTNAMDNTIAQGLITLRIYNYANSTTWKIGEWRSVANNDTTTTNWATSLGFGIYNQTGAITSLQFFDPDGGNLDAGDYTLYGVK